MAYDGSAVDKRRLQDDEGDTLDYFENSARVLSGEEYKTLNSEMFYVEYYNSSVATLSSCTLGISTCTTGVGVFPHGVILISCERDALIEIYEGATYTGGSTINAINVNRRSSDVDNQTFVSSPTVTNEGTRLALCIKISNGTSALEIGGAGFSKGSAFMLKSNTKYIIKVTNLSTSNTSKINIGYLFYEHDI